MKIIINYCETMQIWSALPRSTEIQEGRL